MKLNMDCVRAVMLCVEEHTDFDHYCYFIRYARADILDMLGEEPIDPLTYQVELEAKFDNDDILYSVKYCAEAGLITLCPGSHPEQYRVNIRELTPAGHSFLENIRADTNWAKVKSVTKKAGSFSADVIVEIAKSVAVEAAKHFLSST